MHRNIGGSKGRGRGFAGRLARAEKGGVAIYISLVAVVMIAFAALVVDLGRLFTFQTELQKAVDASALAAAAELDGSAGAIARARLAARDGLVNNRQTFAGGGGQVDFADADIRFLHSLPVSDDDPITAAFETTDDSDARYVEVRASARTVELLLAPVLAHRVGGSGGPEMTTTQTGAVAVAGFNTVVCDFPPLMICNPNEIIDGVGAEFDLTPGTLIELKQGGGSGLWEPGNFGLLDPPSGNQGTPEVVENLASADPSGCFDSPVDLRTGSAQNPVSKGINVRFDMYENPGFKNKSNESKFRPANDVTKGKYKSGNDFLDYTDPTVGMGMPFHQCLTDGTCGTLGPYSHPRFAPPADPGFDPTSPTSQVGFWDQYWTTNHPDDGSFSTMAQSGDATNGIDPIDADGDNIVTRMEMYEWEIKSGKIPANVGDPETQESTATAENGHPMHYTGPPTCTDPDNPCVEPNMERRLMPVAVINCEAEGPLNGNTDNVPVKAYAKMFLTHPAEDGSEQTIYAELVGVLEPGVDDVLHDVIQLYR